MQSARCFPVVLLALGSLGGCAGTDPFMEVKNFYQRSEVEVRRFLQPDGRSQLAAGIRYYDSGRYKEASARLQSALGAGLDNADQVTAHKYLAFVNCAQNRDRQCRAHFRTALELDSSFQLQSAETRDSNLMRAFRQAKAPR